MNWRCQVLLVLTGLTAFGCQRPLLHAQLELINAEKRALEDELYQLQFEYEDAMRQIDKLRRQNERREGGSQPASRDDKSSDGRSPVRRGPPADIDLSPPVIEEGVPVEPKTPPNRGSLEQNPTELPSPQRAAPPAAQRPVPPDPPGPASNSATPVTTMVETKASEPPTRILSLDPTDPRVTHVYLNPALTRGADFDQQPGDDGLVVVVEPRNRDDTFVPLAGPVSVLVLDPERTAEQGRILARWEIDANEAQRVLKNSAAVRGIELKLRWPDDEPPPTSRLELHVRYLTVDHRDLRARRELYITLPGQVAQRWTPRAASRPEAAAPDAPARSAPVAPTETARPEWRPYR